jgi:hypothetical protein
MQLIAMTVWHCAQRGASDLNLGNGITTVAGAAMTPKLP